MSQEEQETKDSHVSYENWYLAQKAMKERIDEIKNQIDRLQEGQDERKKEFDDYIREDMEWKRNDTKWKKSVTPSIEIMKKVEGFSETSTFLMKSILLMGAVTSAIYGLIRWLKN